MRLPTLDDVPADLAGRRVLVRVDLNVPMEDGRVTDTTRLAAARATLLELADRGATVLVLSHFGRPKGGPDPAFSLAPVVPALAAVLGRPVGFLADCVGEDVQREVAKLAPGSITVLENTRFHSGEEANDPAFVARLAALGDLFVNDAFSAAHRAHASTEGLARFLPAVAGRALEREIRALDAVLGTPRRPVLAVVGGAKVSTKIAVLENLARRVDHLAIGGGMANSFLAARGLPVGRSLHEAHQLEAVRRIEAAAEAAGCTVHLPADVVVAREFREHADHRIVHVPHVEPDEMILDVGPLSLEALEGVVDGCATLVWNGPLGAFELPPFDTATLAFARHAAVRTAQGRLVSVAGGGDTVAALNAAGVADRFTLVSTAGGAFLEWMEGRPLPGVEVLRRRPDEEGAADARDRDRPPDPGGL
ncbi:MAG: phosphoglycerate kinase [Sphingomonadaceae bacterium]|nr:phosphoglycerate kinase [Thermaurantiacus sp.]MCS6986663.1 phosphoglycerate kinase [Sphingomonadaceae bacterium]MDW8414075.1 phosphoglycerate kinase [Thermaurantiacus sp.]